MQRSRTMLTLAFAGIAALTLSVASMAEDGKAKKAELKCPVSGQPASKDHAVDYKKGQVYFCCPNCPKAFTKDSAKFATKANHQLVQSGQYVAAKCPISGQPLNPEHTLKVSDVEVTFCCPNCKGKVAGMESEEQKLEAVFAEKPFEKGFQKKEKKDKNPA